MAVRSLLCSLALFSPALFSPALAQQTWYVDVTATGPGNGTPTDPYASIQYAIDHPSTMFGDTIDIAPGTYRENLQLSHDSLTLVGHEGAARTFLRPAGAGPLVTTSGADEPYLIGLTLTGVSDPDIPAVLVVTGTTLFISDCVLTGNAGVGIQNTYDLRMDRCTLTGNGVGIDSPGLTSTGVESSIIWGNDVGIGSPGFVPFVSNSIVQDSLSLCTGGCLQEDPVLWDVGHGDYFLSPGSPAIGSGTGGVDMGAFPFDATHVPDLELYCMGLPNSFGAGARLNSTTPPSVSAQEFVMTIHAAVPGQFGLIYYGETAVQLPFGDGLRCVGAGPAGLFRFAPPVAIPPSGQLDYLVDMSSPPAGSGPGALAPGTTWYFQFWYRDPAGPGGTGFNLSNGLRATFWP